MISRQATGVPCCLLLLCALLLFGCASAKPPAPVSAIRQQAHREESRGYDAYAKRQWTSSAQAFERAANIFGAMDDYRDEANARHNQGQALREAGQTDEAIAALEQARAINQRLGNRPGLAQNLGGLAQCYGAQKNRQAAIRAIEEALKLPEVSKSVTASLQNDLALLLLEDSDEGGRGRILSLLSSALKTSQSLRDRRGIAVGQLNLGRAHLRFGQNNIAGASLRDALELFQSLDDPRGLAHTHESLGELYAVLGDSERARFHLEQARNKFEFLKDDAAVYRLGQAMR